MIMSSTPAVQVACRFRPQNNQEKSQGGINCTSAKDSMAEIDLSHQQDKSSTGYAQFTFDHVFTPKHSQEEIYSKVVAPLVADTLNGFNCTVIAYGQTGSGKTHTMEGPPGCNHNDQDAGVLPRIAYTLFKTIKEEGEGVSIDSDFSFNISMSVIEIYLERIIDLLDSGGGGYKPSSQQEMLKIREDQAGGVYLEGVVEEFVSNPSELLKCLEIAGSRRSTGAHSMNERSSRSHLTAIIRVTQKRGGVITVGKLYICDLAGSEMVRKTEAEGKRLQEAKAINRSLSALGNVINALTQSQAQSAGSVSGGHVPYRDSKLTRLLQDSLGGNAKTALIVTASVSR